MSLSQRAMTLHRVDQCSQPAWSEAVRQLEDMGAGQLEAGEASLRRTVVVTRKYITGIPPHPSKPPRIPGVSRTTPPENQGSQPRTPRRRPHRASHGHVSRALDATDRATMPWSRLPPDDETRPPAEPGGGSDATRRAAGAVSARQPVTRTPARVFLPRRRTATPPGSNDSDTRASTSVTRALLT